MRCNFGVCPDELDLVHRVFNNTEDECIGVEVAIAITPLALNVLLITAPRLEERVWANYVGDMGEDRIPVFGMCTGHWLEASAIVGGTGARNSDTIRLHVAGKMLYDFCNLSGLDPTKLMSILKALGDTK